MNGIFATYFQSFDPDAERRYDPVTGQETPVHAPVTVLPEVMAKNTFRPISPLGKLRMMTVPWSVQRQPVESVRPTYSKAKPDRPTEGKLTVRGFVDPGQAVYGFSQVKLDQTPWWSP